MKSKTLLFVICLLFFTVSAFGQTIDRSKYTAIDPFDYRLDEKKASLGAMRKFKSVVQYVSENGKILSFESLDHGTTLAITTFRKFTLPIPAQKLTIYYTATKRIIDSLILDDMDFTNTTEEGINLVKSPIPASTGINKAEYKEIEVFDYKIEAEQAKQDDVRKYKSKVQFSSQDGISYYFVSPADKTLISMKAGRRFPPLTADQKVTVYYTADKGIVDTISLDDIEF